jgi:hypothetical protein
MTDCPELVLYSRPDCHLCDVAADLLRGLGREWRSVDIDSDPVLVRRYGIRIPVLEHLPSGQVLFWPFDAARIEDLGNS